MSHPLNFNQLRFGHYFIHNPIISHPDSVGVLRAGQLFHPDWKRILCQLFDRFKHPIHHIRRQLAQVFPRGLLPLNAEGPCSSASV
jgi:hypothetical protein